MRRLLGRLPTAAAFLAASVLAPGLQSQENVHRLGNVARQQALQDEPDFDEVDVDAGRAAEADANFDAVMQGNKFAAPRPTQTLEDLARRSSSTAGSPSGATVEVPLDEFSRVRDRLTALREQNARALGPAVVLGAARYEGTARTGALALTLEMRVTLGHPNRWKTVPLVGDDVILVSATAEGVALPVSRQNGYHVWVTRRTGELGLRMDLLVPARGPRGSIEYDFMVARTPVTQFRAHFPVPGLEPKLNAAVSSEVRSTGGSTVLEATLRPTTRVHLVGFRDLGAAEGRAAKIYAETMNLLSIGEGAVELFSVVRYTILYAGTKEFQILVPKDLAIVSADGEGAFRFEIEEREDGKVIRGETAFPIRNSYEISLRLHGELDKDETAIDAPLPRCLGVERESGWLGVEVTGKLKLEETASSEVLRVDVRQLPAEMIKSAVSPILKAYRYHSGKALVRLNAGRLPEREPESGSIDRVRASTRVESSGKVLTDVRITLRNRLRHSLVLGLPGGAKVQSTLLDGAPVKPSLNQKGDLMLPLRRSLGGDRLEPFTVRVVYQAQIAELGIIPGLRDLGLPSVELPISSLAWTVDLPARNLYSGLKGEVEMQRYVGTASWHQPRPSGTSAEHARPAVGGGAAAPSADTGAMPVRIKLPEGGKKLEYVRYWIDAGAPVEVGFAFVRSWLRLPAALLLFLLVAAGVVLVGERWAGRLPPPPAVWLGLGILAVAAILYAAIGGRGMILLALLLGVVVVAWRRGLLPGLSSQVAGWASTLRPRFAERDRPEQRPSVALVLWRVVLGGFLLLFGIMALGSAVGIVALLLNPY